MNKANPSNLGEKREREVLRALSPKKKEKKDLHERGRKKIREEEGLLSASGS